jgi:hypothetical protein
MLSAKNPVTSFFAESIQQLTLLRNQPAKSQEGAGELIRVAFEHQASEADTISD